MHRTRRPFENGACTDGGIKNNKHPNKRPKPPFKAFRNGAKYLIKQLEETALHVANVDKANLSRHLQADKQAEGKQMIKDILQITTINDFKGINARNLHQALKVRRDFSNWIKSRFE
ncbi:Phage anti-repressor protein [Mannheimia haemolytica]|nr:Phage anti-repressor protein [Mannheimia haemolytica]